MKSLGQTFCADQRMRCGGCPLSRQCATRLVGLSGSPPENKMATLSAPDPLRRLAGLKQAIRRIETLREPPNPRGRGRGRRVDDPLLGPAGEAALVDFGLPALDAIFPGGGLPPAATS